MTQIFLLLILLGLWTDLLRIFSPKTEEPPKDEAQIVDEILEGSGARVQRGDGTRTPLNDSLSLEIRRFRSENMRNIQSLIRGLEGTLETHTKSEKEQEKETESIEERVNRIQRLINNLITWCKKFRDAKNDEVMYNTLITIKALIVDIERNLKEIEAIEQSEIKLKETTLDHFHRIRNFFHSIEIPVH